MLRQNIGAGQYKNFVNGVLRSFARGWHEVIIPEDDLSVRYNIPQPIIESFKKDYGETVCIDLLKAMSERAETYIRINPLKTTVDDLIESLPENTAEKAVLQNALCVHGTGDVTGLPGFAEGKFHVQDLSSQLLCAFVSPQPESGLRMSVQRRAARASRLRNTWKTQVCSMRSIYTKAA